MSRHGKRTLDEEERVLWTLVARTATPLRGKTAPEPPVQPAPAVPESAPAPPPPAPVAPVRQQRVGHSLDRQTLTKLTREKLPIEGRVDLHGMTQGEAHGLLLSFLQRAHAGGVRYVLVITGKGSGSGGEGILRRAVPAWLTTPLFRPFVSGYDHAARGHGGFGALYVRLRRRDRPA
jgi:DNA-nicking Smr family endonuclease